MKFRTCSELVKAPVRGTSQTPSVEFAKLSEYPNQQNMSELKSHIDDSFIPEGLEFREEYLQAALGNYRRQKRAILWKRIAVAAVILIVATGVSVAIWNESAKNQRAEKNETNSIIEQEKISNDSSSSIDLDADEETFTKKRQSPAVESSEATQDLSTKAVDMGDPMSSGVGLPGQLSTINPKKTEVIKGKNTTQTESTHAKLKFETESAEDKLPAENTTHGEALEIQRFALPSLIRYLESHGLSSSHELIHGKVIPTIPDRKWSFYALLGAKLWANYSFGSGTRKIDPMLSLGTEFKWRKKLGLFLNAQFFTVSGAAEPYVAKQRQYDEGYRETSFSYHTDRFFYTGLSVGCNYRISRTHTVGVLYDFNYLLTTDNRITTGNSSSYEGATSFEEKAKGYVTGFKPFQHSLGFVYEFAMGKNKSIGASYRLGLSDVTRNEYFGNEFHRNSLLAVHLKIKLK